MKILVTGGAGFIGSHLTERLVREGHRVRVLDNLTTGKRENLASIADHVDLMVGDVRDPDAVLRASSEIEVTFHLAAIVSVQQSVESPTNTMGVNLGGTLQVLQAARACGVRRVVLASSAAVYGTGSNEAKREEMPTVPQSPYGLEKLASEHYMRIWRELAGMETLCLRYFNVFGPRQDPSSPYSGVISIFGNRISQGKRPMIFGDGQQTRDFVYVTDIVEANFRAGFGQAVEGVYNIGCGTEVSLNQLVSDLCEIWGVPLSPEYGNARSGDIRRSLADISSAREILNYAPSVPLKRGLRLLRDSV